METAAKASSSTASAPLPSRASVRSETAAEAAAGSGVDASGSTKVTFRPFPPARTNRNWSPPGRRDRRSPAPAASGSAVDRCFNGRAPRSGVKPSASRKSSAESSNSTAHWRPRRPRRASTAFSSPERISRMIGRDSGRKTTVRSMRFRNSGRNARATACSTAPAANAPEVGEKPRPRPEAIRAPRLEVMMITAWRKSAAPPRGSLSRPSSKTCRNRSQTLGSAFSNSSSSTTENGWRRIRAHERGVVDVAVPEHAAARRARVLVLAHVEPDHPVAGAEEVLGQRLGDLGLAGAGRPDEQQHGLRPGGVGQARLQQRDALDHAVDGLGLADHARAEEDPQRVHVEPLALVQQRGRQARALGDRAEHVLHRQRVVAGRRRRIVSISDSKEPGSAASPRKWRPSASASCSTGFGVERRLARRQAQRARLVHRRDAHDVERVADLRPRADQPVIGAGVGDPDDVDARVGHPRQQQVQRAARVLAVGAGVEQLLDRGDDPDRVAAGERRGRGGACGPRTRRRRSSRR